MNLQQQRDNFLAALQASGRSPRTVHCYRQRIDALIAYLTQTYYPLEHASDFQLNHIQDYHDQLIRRELSSATRQAYLATARVFLNWCQRHHTSPDQHITWIEQIEVPKRPHRLPPTPLTLEEVRALITANPSPRDRAILAVMYACGLRRSEVVTLSICNLLTPRQQLLIHGKGAKDRIVPIAPAAIQMLQAYLATRSPTPTSHDPMFATESSRGPRRLTVDYLSTLFRRMPNPTGRAIRPHLLRHTFAVHLLRGGADVRHVQALLGHASPDTTNQYLGLVKEEIKRAYDRALRRLTRPRKPDQYPYKKAA